MATSEVRPSRRSILASGQVKPVGPHQRRTCSGSVQACHTCPTGGSTTRLITSSRFWFSTGISVLPFLDRGRGAERVAVLCGSADGVGGGLPRQAGSPLAGPAFLEPA